MNQKQFIRNYKVINKGIIDFFLGAGASFSSNIPTGGDLVWYFKREIYCTENGISQDRFKDLKSEANRLVLQNFFDLQADTPKRGDSQEYSFYFEKCYDSWLARKSFIDSLVEKRNPAIGYLCLANLILNSRISNIWTTNFDQLLETAIANIDPAFPFNLCSSANAKSFDNLNLQYPCIYKLHGDYRYDKLQNTNKELKELEQAIHSQFYTKLCQKGLLVIGYSGSDESIMSFFEEHVSDKTFLEKGLYWTTLKGCQVSNRVASLINSFNKNGKPSSIIEIDNFDEFLLNIYFAIGESQNIIDKRIPSSNNNTKLQFRTRQKREFIKLNGFKSKAYPQCNVFDTDIQSWKTLRECKSYFPVALFKEKIYCFAKEDQIKTVFKEHVMSDILSVDVPEYILLRNESIYVGMLYELIGNALRNKGLEQYGKTKFFDKNTVTEENGILAYEALEIGLNYLNKSFYLNLIPTFHFTKKNGDQLEKFEYQKRVNYKANIYNKPYDEILKKWQAKLISDGKMLFTYNDYSIEFSIPASSCGGINQNHNWVKFDAYHLDEPALSFSTQNTNNSINQLKGLVQYGPIDASFSTKPINRSQIKLCVLSPDNCVDKILGHLNNLSCKIQNNSKDSFLPNYEGFNEIYRRPLLVPTKDQKNLCVIYSYSTVYNYTPSQFVDFLKRGIDKFALTRTDYDILVIYIPKSFTKFRNATSISQDFDLHDALKLYATDKGVTIQFIEERSLDSGEQCKVLWGLSTALYAKASMGVLWQPQEIQENTAYIGISYAISKEKGICIGCSQLFDATGTGMRMLLRKIDSPVFAGHRNPYMGKDEARSMMIALRDEYYRCNPTAKLDRIVIHKTTPFMKDEMIGITQAFEGISDIELIQIQDYNHWRGIRYGIDYKTGAESYPMERGTVIQLNDNSVLLWTHGSLKHPELGKGNYYKNGRGIPSPLLIKRYHGNSSGESIVKEILMLTKMNWNSGDSLYKVLPVTLDFAKVLSRMSKQDEAIFNKAYDFRYFM